MKLNPQQFISQVIPGSDKQILTGSVIEWNDDDNGGVSAERFESCVAKHYEYTKNDEYPGEVYFTLGMPL